MRVLVVIIVVLACSAMIDVGAEGDGTIIGSIWEYIKSITP